MRQLLYILIIGLCFPLFVRAQDAEPTLSVDDLYRWSAEVYFPQEIDFQITAIRRESVIASLTLSVSYRGTDPEPIAIDLSTIDQTNAGGVFRYIWEVPRGNPPPLFLTVRYTWDIVTTSGESYSITDMIEFTDHRVEWVKGNDLQSQANIFYAQNQLEPESIWRGIRSTYELLFGDASDKPLLNLLIYPEDVPIGCNLDEEDEPVLRVRRPDGFETIDCNLSLAQRIYDASGFVVLVEMNANAFQQTIIALLVDEYYADRWGSVDVPDWFLYGLQQFYDPRPKVPALQIARQEARSNDLLDFDALNVPPDIDTQLIWQAQSTGMVLYIADTIGVPELLELANSIGDYEAFADAYEDQVGQPLDVLILAWQDWLFRSTTEQDYEYNLYLPDTPTPTATNTPTNTPTVTFTPSKTPDVTRTPRPSVTPIPPTRTITPLPAQSFSVQPTDRPPTPIPVEPEPQFALDEDFITRAGLGAAVIFGLLVLLYFVLRKR